MATPSDILAGRAAVQLWVDDSLFKKQIAQSTQAFQGDIQDDFDHLADVANASLDSVHQDTLILSTYTQKLDNALRDVIASYEDLQGLSEDGITISGGGEEAVDISTQLEKGALMGLGSTAAGKLASTLSAKLMPSISAALSSSTEKALADVVSRLSAPAAAAASGVSSVGAAAGAANAPVAALAATTSTALLPALVAVAAAVAVALPVFAALDDQMGGTLSKSGYYPEWLKNIGDAMNSFGPIGVIVNGFVSTLRMLGTVLVEVFGTAFEVSAALMAPFAAALYVVLKACQAVNKVALMPFRVLLFAIRAPLQLLWKAVSILSAPFQLLGKAVSLLAVPFQLLGKAISWLINTCLLPLKALMFTITSPFKAFSISLNALKTPLRWIGDGIAYLVAGLKRMVAAMASAVSWTVKLGASVVTTARNTVTAAVTGTRNAIAGIGTSVKSVGKTLALLGGGMTALGSAIVAPLARAGAQFAEFGEDVLEVARKHKIGADNAATYAYMAKVTGRSIEDLMAAMPATTTAIDKNGVAVKRASKEFAAWRAEAQAAGLWMGGVAANSAMRLADAYADLRRASHGFWVTLGSAVAPSLEKTANLMSAAIRGVTKWVSENKPLIASIFDIAKKVAMAGTAIATLGGALVSVGAAISPLTVALAAIAGGLAIVERRTGTGRGLWQAYGDQVKRVYETVREYVGKIMEFTSQWIGGVKDAILGGDLKLAVAIAWSGARVAWNNGLTEISNLTRGVFGGILNNLAAGQWKAAAAAAMAMVEQAFWRVMQVADDAWSYISNTADVLWVGLQDGFDFAMTWLEKGWIQLFDKMKETSADFLRWMVTNVMLPLTASLSRMPLIGESANKAGNAAMNEMLKAANSISDSRTPVKDQMDAVDKASLDRRAARHKSAQEEQDTRDEAAVGRWIARRERIAELERTLADLAAKGTEEALKQREEIQKQYDKELAAARKLREEAEAERKIRKAEMDLALARAAAEEEAAKAKKKAADLAKGEATKGFGTFSAAEAVGMFGGIADQAKAPKSKRQLEAEKKNAMRGASQLERMTGERFTPEQKEFMRKQDQQINQQAAIDRRKAERAELGDEEWIRKENLRRRREDPFASPLSKDEIANAKQTVIMGGEEGMEKSVSLLNDIKAVMSEQLLAIKAMNLGVFAP